MTVARPPEDALQHGPPHDAGPVRGSALSSAGPSHEPSPALAAPPLRMATKDTPEAAADDVRTAAPATVRLPLLGERSAAAQQRLLAWLLLAALLVLVALGMPALQRGAPLPPQAGAVDQALATARSGHDGVADDSQILRRALEQLQSEQARQRQPGTGLLAAVAAAALVALLAAGGLLRVRRLDRLQRDQLAEQTRQQAERQQHIASNANEANQAAILRLMDELRTVAAGDLTQQASVTGEFTGALADSVNDTVEELRALVGSVQHTVTRVAQTTADVDKTSAALLATSSEQLREIRETGRAVLDMAARIHDVSAQAQASAQVARQSLQATDSGLTAVQNTIGGMNAIREQIQDTSKRIKRLGESSQEIGEITELISDITEQTHVLALNAAIQAASAGDAGRGFSVVAEEVQRLAERSGDATRQIAALVRTIQTDTQDAVAAMERSTQGVVAGAQLSDTAGTALTEIDQVSRRLAELIEQIAGATSREAELASGVADHIQHIFAVTEQTGDGTRATAQQVRELAEMAAQLSQSVARFKIV